MRCDYARNDRTDARRTRTGWTSAPPISRTPTASTPSCSAGRRDVSGDEYGGYTTFLLQRPTGRRGGPARSARGSRRRGAPTSPPTTRTRSAARVTAAGGKVLVPPFDVMEQGRMAAFLDQAGAPFSVWQPGTMRGRRGVRRARRADLERADHPRRGRLEGVLRRGVRLDGPGQLDGRHCRTWCGSRTARPSPACSRWTAPSWPDDMSPHWMIYFAVADCDETVALARQLGGRVVGRRELPDRPVRGAPGSAGRHLLGAGRLTGHWHENYLS